MEFSIICEILFYTLERNFTGAELYKGECIENFSRMMVGD
jgi:hypothetical protein